MSAKTLVLLSLLLAGCGGGGSNTDPVADPPAAVVTTVDPPATPVANPLEGVYSYGGGPPGLVVDANGNFWLVTKIVCAWFESGVFLDTGVAGNIGNDSGQEDCTSANDIGPASLAITGGLIAGQLTMVEGWTYQQSTPPNYLIYTLVDGTRTDIWTQLAPSAPSLSNIAGTWALVSNGDIRIPYSTTFTIASDGTFTLNGCSWQAEILDTAVNVYTLTSSCGVGVLTLWNGQLIGGITSSGLTDLSAIQPLGIYP